MAPIPPVVVGMTLCREIVIEGQPGEFTLKRVFSGVKCTSFPALMDSPICVHVGLTDGMGDVTVDLHVERFGDSLEHIRRSQRILSFRDRHQPVELLLRLPQFVFPASGDYLFALSLNGEWAAQRSIRVYLGGES